MLQEIIDLQSSCVNNLLSLIDLKREITFKAPTGSGKTYMMSDLMNRVLRDNGDVIFIVSSLSKGDLAKQNYDKFTEYKESGDFKHLNPYLINSETSGENSLYIPTDYNVYVLPRDLYKDKSKLKQGAFINFLREITYINSLNKKIYVIKDECHIATSNLDSLQKEYFSRVINFSATPKKEKGIDVELHELDAINTHLIKRVEYQLGENGLDTALDKFCDIKTQYIEKVGINPCMIIQISNKELADKQIDEIKRILNANYHELKWMLIVDDDGKCDTNDVFKVKKLPVSKWKDYAKTNTCTIDIIIFKMVITEGWDIPRACMLYQVRDSKSKQLDEQVTGRVRRNPRLQDFEKLSKDVQDLISVAYVWGIQDKESKSFNEVRLVDDEKVKGELKLKTTRIKDVVKASVFDVDKYLEKKPPKLVHDSIFDLYDGYRKQTNEVKSMYESYVNSIPKWFKFMEYIDDISNETRNVFCDYDTNMEITKDDFDNEIEFTLPAVSYYFDNQNYKNINDWLWVRTDGSKTFSFDSEAESEWVEILKELSSIDSPTGDRLIKDIDINEIIDGTIEISRKYLYAKNFLPNSSIKYEYYLNGVHSSYPDFIMKDHKDRIHLFETKSINQSSIQNIDFDEYEEKVRALKDCYKVASKLTGYYFYIPIKKADKWNIYLFDNGIENELTIREFTNFIKY